MQNQLPLVPADGPLIDTFGRIADDLRISVTDRCNFRCTYCMPAEGLQWLPKEELLSFEELTRLLALFVRLGVRGLKITGGEPTIRADLPSLVKMFRSVGPELDMSITTNAMWQTHIADPSELTVGRLAFCRPAHDWDGDETTCVRACEVSRHETI